MNIRNASFSKTAKSRFSRNGLQDDLQRIVERIKFTDNVMNLVESQQSRVELMTVNLAQGTSVQS